MATRKKVFPKYRPTYGRTLHGGLGAALDADHAIGDLDPRTEWPGWKWAQWMERMAEEEFEARTWNGWSRDLCNECYTALSASGTCLCADLEDEGLTVDERFLKKYGLLKEKPKPPRATPKPKPIVWDEATLKKARHRITLLETRASHPRTPLEEAETCQDMASRLRVKYDLPA